MRTVSLTIFHAGIFRRVEDILRNIVCPYVFQVRHDAWMGTVQPCVEYCDLHRHSFLEPLDRRSSLVFPDSVMEMPYMTSDLRIFHETGKDVLETQVARRQQSVVKRQCVIRRQRVVQLSRLEVEIVLASSVVQK
jgi:hypothetical protein